VKQKLEIRRNIKELIGIDNDKTPPVVVNMTDWAGLKFDWRLRLSRLNMTDFDLAKYDWRRRECGGGSDDDSGPFIATLISWSYSQPKKFSPAGGGCIP
jgi:hypothetical protein